MEIVGLRKNTVLVSLIVGVDGWGRMISLKKKKLLRNLKSNKKAETKLGDFPGAVQMAAPLPEANASQPLNDLSPNQTRSQPFT